MQGRFANAVFCVAVLAVCIVMTHRRLSEAQAQAPGKNGEQKVSADERLYMLNVIWYKPDGGADKYEEYVRAAGPIVRKYGGKLDSTFVPEVALIGKFDADLIFFVEWPSAQDFREFVQDPGYQKIRRLREEAIRDSLLVRCKKQ